MKIALVGQQDFGKAVLEAFLAPGDAAAGVFSAPEKPGAAPGDEVAGVICVTEKPGGKRDALKVAAQEKGLEVFQFPPAKAEAANTAMQKPGAEIANMASGLQFAPQDFVNIPKRGTIQYHP